jgi:energy-converting hydrogenase A subunit M
MKKFKVNVCRISYAYMELEIEGEDIYDVTMKAKNEAGNYEFHESSAEYEVEGVNEIKPKDNDIHN